MDPIGNIPLFITVLKNVGEKRQKWIIFREMTIALVIIILFNYIGDALMHFLKVGEDTIQIAGGLILFIIALKMIFPTPHDTKEKITYDTEPFIVPLAVPLVAGPSVLAAVMILARQEMHPGIMIGAILVAWTASLIILLASSYIRNVLGWRGIMAMERLMGLILTLIAVQMFLSGLSIFMQHHYQ